MAINWKAGRGLEYDWDDLSSVLISEHGRLPSLIGFRRPIEFGLDLPRLSFGVAWPVGNTGYTQQHTLAVSPPRYTRLSRWA